MHVEAKGRGSVDPTMPPEAHLARVLQAHLEAAKLDRHELITSDATRKRLGFHDLRATGITWLAVRGDDPLKIMQRAGHKEFKTTQGYIREAEAIREGFGDVFPPLPPGLLNAPSADPEERAPEGLLSRCLPQLLPQMPQVLEMIVGVGDLNPQHPAPKAGPLPG